MRNALFLSSLLDALPLSRREKILWPVAPVGNATPDRRLVGRFSASDKKKPELIA